MEIQKRITGDTHELLVAGRVHGDGADQLEVEVLAPIQAQAQTIHVNLRPAMFLCSALRRVLLQCWRPMKRPQRVRLVTNPAPEFEIRVL